MFLGRYSTSNYQYTDSGLAYSDVYEPDEFGSGGGGYSGSTYYGGNGGGRIWVNVTDTLDVDGLISSHGGAATSSGSYVGGGGSAGSVWIYTYVIKG